MFSLAKRAYPGTARPKSPFRKGGLDGDQLQGKRVVSKSSFKKEGLLTVAITIAVFSLTWSPWERKAAALQEDTCETAKGVR